MTEPATLALALAIPIAIAVLAWTAISHIAERTITRAIIRAAHQLDRERKP